MDIVYIRKDLIASWRATVEAVAAERKYLGRVTLPPFDPETAFPLKLIENDWPMYCAITGDEVVGWADITLSDIPECTHRGTLGMGVSAQHRGKGIGSRLLEACLAHARKISLAKVELAVYTNNAAAIALYRKYGFTDVGIRRDYRRLDGITYDELLMDLFLD